MRLYLEGGIQTKAITIGLLTLFEVKMSKKINKNHHTKHISCIMVMISSQHHWSSFTDEVQRPRRMNVDDLFDSLHQTDLPSHRLFCHHDSVISR